MVGVPGRSKGCATCRKRKKGCDLQRPTCGQCLKSGLECGGYDRQRIFINHTTSPPSSLAVAPRSKPRFPDVPPVEVTLPDGLTRTAYELKSLGLFWEAYLPRGVPFTSSSDQLSTGSWLRMLDSIYQREPALKHALLAISLGIVGRQRADGWMLSQGYVSHGKALRDMAQALQLPERARRDELIAASKLLGLFEILFGADDKDAFAQARSWGSHVNGEMLLIHARGPQSHMRGNAHTLFADGRFNMMIQAARSRKRTVFSSPEWKEIPWQNTPKTPKDALLDIMIDLPALMENLDNCIEGDHDADKRECLREALIQECWDADKRLLEWTENMRHVIGVDLDALDFVEQLGDFAAAQLVYTYWAGCIMLFSLLRSAVVPSPQSEPLPPRTEPAIYARKIARSASYFFGPEAGVFGTHAASFPIGMALSVLLKGGSQEDENRKLLTSVFSIPGLGVIIAKFLSSMRAGYNIDQCRFRGPVSF